MSSCIFYFYRHYYYYKKNYEVTVIITSSQYTQQAAGIYIYIYIIVRVGLTYGVYARSAAGTVLKIGSRPNAIKPLDLSL